jgi:predicted SpoU family rRNA methylase
MSFDHIQAFLIPEFLGQSVLKSGHFSFRNFKIRTFPLCFALDYKSTDKVILTLSGAQGIKLSAGNKLKFSGSVSRDLVNRSWDGEYAIKLETIVAQISQEFIRKGAKTSAEITIKF